MGGPPTYSVCSHFPRLRPAPERRGSDLPMCPGWGDPGQAVPLIQALCHPCCILDTVFAFLSRALRHGFSPIVPNATVPSPSAWRGEPPCQTPPTASAPPTLHRVKCCRLLWGAWKSHTSPVLSPDTPSHRPRHTPSYAPRVHSPDWCSGHSCTPRTWVLTRHTPQNAGLTHVCPDLALSGPLGPLTHCGLHHPWPLPDSVCRDIVVPQRGGEDGGWGRGWACGRSGHRARSLQGHPPRCWVVRAEATGWSRKPVSWGQRSMIWGFKAFPCRHHPNHTPP